MVGPLLARSSLQAARVAVPRQALTQQIRNVHIENKVHYTLPFEGGPKNKGKVALIFAGFFGTATALPLVVVGYQMTK